MGENGKRGRRKVGEGERERQGEEEGGIGGKDMREREGKIRKGRKEASEKTE